MLILLLSLAACSKNKETASKKEDVKEEEKVEQKQQEFAYTYSLTGIETNENVNHRAIGVMINNHPAARPQSGLHKADVVYEIIAEGGITRFLAIFQSEMPERVGPVRSARDYYIELAKGFDSIFVHHGWSPQAKKLIESGYIDSLNGLFYDGTLFVRSNDRKAPHNSYISYENIVAGAERNKFKLEGAPEPLSFLSKDQLEELSGTKATNITVNYSSSDFQVRYEYDSVTNKYRRYSANIQTVDYDTEEEVLLDNIIIYEIPHQSIDDYGRNALSFESGGKGYLFQKGIMKEIEWKYENNRLIPLENGKEASLVPGKTWINIVPTYPGLSQSVTVE